MYTALGCQFEEKLLKVASNFITQELNKPTDYSKTMSDTLEYNLPEGSLILSDYYTSETYSTITSISLDELERWNKAYATDLLLSQVLNGNGEEDDSNEKYTQYQVRDNGLI